MHINNIHYFAWLYTLRVIVEISAARISPSDLFLRFIRVDRGSSRSFLLLYTYITPQFIHFLPWILDRWQVFAISSHSASSMTGPAPPTCDSYGSFSQRIAECNHGVNMPVRMMDWNQPLQVGGSTRWHLGCNSASGGNASKRLFWRQTGGGTRNSGQRTLTPVL